MKREEIENRITDLRNELDDALETGAHPEIVAQIEQDLTDAEAELDELGGQDG